MRRALLDSVQSAAFAADRKLASAVEAGSRAARALNLGGRAAVVVLGLALGFLVVTGMISLVAAAALAVALLFMPDQLTRLDRALHSRRQGVLAGLLGRDAFFDHAAAWLASVPAKERLTKYLVLLARGEVSLPGVLLTLEASEGGSTALVTSTA